MARIIRRTTLFLLVVATALVGLAGPASAQTEAASRPASVSNASHVSSAAAGTVGYSVTNAHCYSNAITFTARTYETGLSGVQRFRQKAVLQQYTTFGWVKVSTRTVRSVQFANTSATTSFTLDWTGSHPANGASYREVWQGFYLNGAGAVIAKTTKVTITCL